MKQRIDQTIAISHAVADEMLGRAEVLSDRLSVVHHGIADPRSLVKSQRDAIRQSQGIRPDQLLLVCSARLEPEKDISTLVEAMAAVVRQIPGAVCLIAGEGSLHASIESQIQACGLTQSVRLMGFRSDVPDLLCAADLFVLPALAEPFGLSIVEAMAFGLPVIATNAGGPREIVEANASGLFVKPGSASDTARAIIGLLGDSRRRAEMGQKARRRYQENFSLERMATQTALIYQKALSTAAGAGGESEARAAELTRGIA
jgi:glycosyltransferase involved in cell wall biosynthesis